MKKKTSILLIALSILAIISSCNSPKKALEALKYESNKARIIYVYDPLCGWCYAFKSVMQAFKQKHTSEIEFEILSGGMIIGEPKDSVGKMREFFSESIPMLEEQTGAKFGDAFKKSLQKNGRALFSSEKPSIALTVYKSLAKENSTLPDPFAFATSIQAAIYYDGMPPDENSTYLSLAKKTGVNEEEFTKRLADSLYYKQTWKEFAISRGLKANGYPTVFLMKENGKLIKLTDGYTGLQELEAAYQNNK